MVDQSVSVKAIKSRRQISNNNREWHARTLRDISSSTFVHPWFESKDCNWVSFQNIGLNFCTGLPDNVFQVLNNSIVSLSQVNVLPTADKNGKLGPSKRTKLNSGSVLLEYEASNGKVFPRVLFSLFYRDYLRKMYSDYKCNICGPSNKCYN